MMCYARFILTIPVTAAAEIFGSLVAVVWIYSYWVKRSCYPYRGPGVGGEEG